MLVQTTLGNPWSARAAPKKKLHQDSRWHPTGGFNGADPSKPWLSILKYTKTYWNILKWCNFGWFGVPPLKAQTQFNQFNPTGLHPLPLSSSRALISRKIHNFRLLKNFVRPRAALGCTMSQAIRGSNIRKTVENPCSFIRWLRNIWQNTTPLLLQRLKILYIVTLTVSKGTSSPVVGCLRFCSCMPTSDLRNRSSRLGPSDQTCRPPATGRLQCLPSSQLSS